MHLDVQMKRKMMKCVAKAGSDAKQLEEYETKLLNIFRHMQNMEGKSSTQSLRFI